MENKGNLNLRTWGTSNASLQLLIQGSLPGFSLITSCSDLVDKTVFAYIHAGLFGLILVLFCFSLFCFALFDLFVFCFVLFCFCFLFCLVWFVCWGVCLFFEGSFVCVLCLLPDFGDNF